MKTIKNALLNNVLAFVGVAMLCTAVSAHAAPSVLLQTGTTSVALAPSFTSALTTLGVSAGKISPALITKNGTAVFPVSYGVLDAQDLVGEIIHTGGLSLAKGSTRVTLTGFLIDTANQQVVITALASVNGSVETRLPVFNLQLPALTLPLALPRTGKVRIPGVKVTLTEGAAGVLNQVFGVTAFTGGLEIGTALVSTRAKAL